MSRAEQSRSESAKRRRSNVARAVPVAVGSFTIAAFHVGILGAVVTAVVTLTAVFGLLWLLLRVDRSRRARRLAPGVLATAGASVRGAEIARLDPTKPLHFGPAALLVGDAEVTTAAFVWKPRKRFQRRGATDVVLSFGEISEVNCVRLGGVIRCDACCFTLNDGREFVVNITSPVGIEEALSTAGVTVTGDGPGHENGAAK